jgi:sugar lactone lactonase YvrE
MLQRNDDKQTFCCRLVWRFKRPRRVALRSLLVVPSGMKLQTESRFAARALRRGRSGRSKAWALVAGSLASIGLVVGGQSNVASAAPGDVSTIVGTPAANGLNNPWAVAVDNAGNAYVADFGNNTIQKVTPTGAMTTFAGSGTAAFADGLGTAASFSGPTGVAIDGSGNLYVSDFGNNRIRKITSAGLVTTLAGNGAEAFADGAAASASFSAPYGIAVDALANNVYVADTGNERIRRVSGGIVSTLAGNGTPALVDGPGAIASFYSPYGVAVDSSSNVYVADYGNDKIRAITPAGVVSTVATASAPVGVAVDGPGNVYASAVGTRTILMIAVGGAVSTLAGNGTDGSVDGPGGSASFSAPYGMAVVSGNVYVADFAANKIRRIRATGLVDTIAPSPINGAEGVTVDTAGNTYIADSGGNRVLKLSTLGVLSTLAGNGTAGFADGPQGSSILNFPTGIGVDSLGNVFVGDTINHRVRRITPGGVTSTFAGSGTIGSSDGPTVEFNFPTGIAVDTFNNVYVGDGFNNKIRKITSAGVVSTFAGTGASGSNDGPGVTATFNSPRGLAVDRPGPVRADW